jgi:hypothetical protein
MPKLLTKLKINEISVCDRGAGEGCKVTLLKRHDPDERRTGNGYHPQELAKAVTQSLKVPDHIKSVADAKHWLLFDRSGEMLRSQHKDADLDALAGHIHEAINGERQTNKRDEDAMTDPNSAAGLLAVAKRRGATMEDLCRHVIKHGACDQTEASFTELMMMHTSAHKRDGESDASAFSRMFSGNDPAAVLMRKAHDTVRKGVVIYVGEGLGTDIMDREGVPVMYPHSRYDGIENFVGGGAAMRMGATDPKDEEEDREDPFDDDAYEELDELAEKAAAADPSLSKHQHFARLYAKRRDLARRERRGSYQKMMKSLNYR